MAKLLNQQDNILQTQIFYPHIEKEASWNSFLNSELGDVYQSIPWKELSSLLGTRRKSDTRGKKPIFGLQGEIALMFLKTYSGLSDQKLIDRINTDYHYQYFCRISIIPGNQIKDGKLPSKIRCKLSRRLKLADCQKVLADYWKPYMEDTHVGLADATCYETDMRYPTSVKLLWESCQWLDDRMKGLCKKAGIRLPRNKFSDQKLKTLAYLKTKKKTYKLSRKRVSALLYLLDKLLHQIEDVEQGCTKKGVSSSGYYYAKKGIIETVLVQQFAWYQTGDKPRHLIVSLAKEYIRPIVRGKENKRVEWGAKLNKLQVDGINFIEHISCEAFHEGNRLKQTIWLHRKLFGRCTHIAADAIYATNKNRKYCSDSHITTSFVRKGRPATDEDQRKQIRSLLSKQRATRLEGSFGIEKEHYGLKRIRARSRSTEILWIFFGIHTVNAVEIGKRIRVQKEIPIEKAA